ncbi:MAG: hypothetical protein ACEPOW_00610 [Bacteroidales bacterium]
MIKRLRNRHRRWWQIWTILLPLLFILAIVYTPRFYTQELVVKELPTPLEYIVKMYEGDNYKINIRSDEAGAFQLELFLKEPLKLPAPLMYVSYLNKKDVLLGNTGQKGLYRWPVADTLFDKMYFKSTLGNYPKINIPF